MIITNSSIGMDSLRTYTSVSTDAYLRERSVTTITSSDFLDSLKNAYMSDISTKNEELDDKKNALSKDSKEADTLSKGSEESLDFLKSKFSDISTDKISRLTKHEEDLKSAIRYLCLNLLLMLIFGKNAGSDSCSKLNPFGDSGALDANLPNASMGLNNFEFTKITDSITLEHYEAEYESTSFNAKGLVKTADGRELDIDIELSMSKSFESYTKETGIYDSLKLKLIDPLVINLDSCAADISDQKFYFDLDCDGIEDEISSLGAGSGFLALDLNDDGEINDGSELFGTKSGNGFRDLSKYDKDGNGFIDEADEIFDKLKIMCFNEDGTRELYSLKDKGVGAIYLGSKETEFSVTNQENKLNAQIRRTGIFLYESGIQGTIQHVDLAVELGA